MRAIKKHHKLKFIIRAAISWLLLKLGSRPYGILVKQLKNRPKIYFYLIVPIIKQFLRLITEPTKKSYISISMSHPPTLLL